MFVMPVMLSMLLLLLLKGMGWLLLLAMAERHICRTAKNRILASVAATKLLRWWKGLLSCSISSSGTQSMDSSTQLPRSLYGYAITGFAPVELILQQIMLRIFTIFSASISGEGEQKSGLRWRNTYVHAVLSVRLMFLVLHLRCTPPPGPNSGGTLNSHVFQDDSQWWMAVVVTAMNAGLVLSINDLSFIPICREP